MKGRKGRKGMKGQAQEGPSKGRAKQRKGQTKERPNKGRAKKRKGQTKEGPNKGRAKQRKEQKQGTKVSKQKQESKGNNKQNIPPKQNPLLFWRIWVFKWPFVQPGPCMDHRHFQPNALYVKSFSWYGLWVRGSASKNIRPRERAFRKTGIFQSNVQRCWFVLFSSLATTTLCLE